MIHSENFQALNLLQERYKDKVDNIFIDPPYNTGDGSDFIYKDNYRHSSWLSMIKSRIIYSRRLLKEDGLFALTLDDVEQSKSIILLNSI